MARKKDVMRPFIFEDILEHFNWSGEHMVFPYTLNGHNKKAVIKVSDLYKIIKWKTCDKK